MEVQASTGTGRTSVPRSSSPPSSHGSKSNSPLLNGHISNSVVNSDDHFFGKHNGFTLSPIKEKKPLPENGAPPALIPIPPTKSPEESTDKVSSPSSVEKKSIVISNNTPDPGWNIKPVNNLPSNVWPPNSQSPSAGSKVIISGPSLQASTNPAVAPSAPPFRTIKDESPPPPYSSVVPPVAIVNPTRRAPSARPLSVPDASALVEHAPEPPVQSVNESNSKQDPSTKPSAVSRIASFLSKKEKNEAESNQVQSHTLPRKAAKINRESLLQLEISAPMQLHATELPNNLLPVRPAPDVPMPNNILPSQVKASQKDDNTKSKVSWAQSVADNTNSTSKDNKNKDKIINVLPSVDNQNKNNPIINNDLQRIGSVRESSVTVRPNIPKFGSMRAPRPKSLPPTRPSQPPPRPPLPMIPGTPESENIYETSAVHSDEEDRPNSPQESIYATIDEKSPEQEKSPPISQSSPPASQKKDKKSMFSFLYSKPKRKKLEEEKEFKEPLYCNIDPSGEPLMSPDDDVISEHIYSTPATSPIASPTRSSTSSPARQDRNSCGSSEDGGLLSEIVSELANREPEIVNSLGNKNKTKKSSSIEAPKVSNEGNSTPKSFTVPTICDSNKTNLSKSPTYPWRSNKTEDITNSDKIKSNTSLKSNISSKNPSVSQSNKINEPRGVFSYLKKAPTKSESANVNGKSNVSSSTVKNISDLSKDKADSSTTSLKSPVISTPVLDNLSHPTTNVPSNLAASLAAVRAAGAAAGEAAAAATLAKNKTELDLDLESKKNDVINKGNPTRKSDEFTTPSDTNKPIASSSILSPISKPTDISAIKTKPTNTLSSISKPSTITKMSNSSNEKKPDVTIKPKKIVFPPDKIVFPPDKQPVSHEKTGAPNTVQKKSLNQQGPLRSISKIPSNNSIKDKQSVTSPTDKIKPKQTNLNARPSTGSAGKSGKALSRATTPIRSSSAGSGEFEKKKIASQTSIDKDEGKLENKKNSVNNISDDKTKPKIPDKSKEAVKKAVNKPQSNINVRKPLSSSSSRATSSNSIRSGTNASGISHVAALQKKFENETAESDSSSNSKPAVKSSFKKNLDNNGKQIIPKKLKNNS